MDWSSFTTEQLARLAVGPGPQGRDARAELARRQAAADPGPPTNLVDARQKFLADQAWAGLSVQQQAAVNSLVAAQVRTGQAQNAISVAIQAQDAARAQFDTAASQLGVAVQATQAVVAALPAADQAALTSQTQQVTDSVQAVQASIASADQAMQQAQDAHDTLTAATDSISVAAAVSVAATVSSPDGNPPASQVDTTPARPASAAQVVARGGKPPADPITADPTGPG